ncbi:MAG: S8 family serine peptidase [Ilumatobacteraceae bacterium]
MRAVALCALAGLVAPAPGTGTIVTAASGHRPDVAALAPHAPDVLLVGFDRAASAAERAAARAALHVAASAQLSPLAGDVERWTLPATVPVTTALAVAAALPGVRFAEPDYIATAAAVSNDPLVTNGTLWGMYGNTSTPANQFGSQAAEAWARNHTGSSSVVIGVIDEGIQATHPDLVDNMWVNPVEQAGVAGIDDDRNGYIDDLNGFDFHNNDATVYDGGATGNADTHGTHVAGTIGAAGGNGIGVAGAAWDVTIVSGKFLGATGGFVSDAVRAVDYMTDLATRHSLRMIATNNSWAGGGFSQAMLDAINRGGNAGILFVTAAGNATGNNDLVASYPASYQCTTATRAWDCVISVGAVTSTGGLASFSNYGPTTVDIAAPGVNITSTLPPSAYGSLNGTSMSTPHVTGALVLCAAANASRTPAQMRSLILDSMVPTSALNGRTHRAGRLDANSLVTACVGGSAPTGNPSSLVATATAWNATALSWTDGVTGETNWVVQRALSTSGVCGTFASVGTFGADVTQFYDSRLSGSTAYCYRVQATGGGAATAVSNTATITTPVAPPQPAPYTCTSTTYSWMDYNVGATRRSLADDAGVSVALPFSFPFYGVSYSTVTMSSNGYIRFGTADATSFLNTPIPNILEPNNIAAPWWDDINPSLSGSTWTIVQGTSPNRRFAASWVDVVRAGGSTNPVTFQVVLDEATKSITFQYRDAVTDLDSNGGSATVGVESPDGEMGTLVSHNQSTLQSSTAYRCSDSGGAAPVAVATSSLPNGTVGQPYSTTLTATGGSGTYGWSVSAGTLPAGLSLSSAGVLSGTPTAAGTSTFSVTAVDTAPGATGVAAKELTLTINPAALPGAFVKSSPKSGATGVKTSVSLSWGAATGATRYEYCIDTTVNGTCGATWISTATARSVALSGLLKGTRYEWQVRAVNTAGTTLANAGTWWTFTTATR